MGDGGAIMKKQIAHILAGILCLYFFNFCSKEKTFDCVKSTGDLKKEDRYFDNFSVLYVEDNINVVLVQSLAGKVTVEAGENLLSKIKCVQEGKKLTIKNKNTCNWVRKYDVPINIYVGVDQIKEISQSGYGKISEGEYIKTDTLRIYNLTFGDTDLSIDADFVGFMADDHASFKIRGNVNKIAGSCFKNGLADTKDAKCQWIYVINRSLLDAEIYSDSLVQADISGDGNIICNGHPPYVEYKHLFGKGGLQLP
jgi:hypothetical protein